jgi:hypothetical protein
MEFAGQLLMQTLNTGKGKTVPQHTYEGAGGGDDV